MSKVISNFMAIAGGTFINMFLGFLTTPIITRIVRPEEYGQFSIFTMYAGIMSMVLCLGMDQALMRFFYEVDTKDYRRELVKRCVQLPMYVSLIILCICIFCTYADIFVLEFSQQIVILLCVFILIQLLHRFGVLLIRLQHKAKLYSLLMIVQKMIYIVVAVPVLIFSKIEHLLVLVLGTMLAAFFCLVISIYLEKDIWRTIFKHRETECVSKGTLLKYSYPYIFSMGITMIFQAVDQISLNILCTYKEVGIYASAMSLVHIFSVVQTAFNTIWAPASVEHFAQNQEDKNFYVKGNQSITVVMYFIGITLILCKDIFVILLGTEFREAAYILPFLIFNPIMYTISETTVSGLLFFQKSKMHIVIAVGACITNIIGNIILIPCLGCRGAAISTGISYIVFFSLRTLFSNHYFYIDFHLKRFYFMTVIVSLYAMYNTFFGFGVISAIGYVLCLIFLMILYREIISFGLRNLFKIVL